MTTTEPVVEHGITITEVTTPAGTPRRADCFCGWQSELVASNPIAWAAGEAHLIRTATTHAREVRERIEAGRVDHGITERERTRQRAYDEGYAHGIEASTGQRPARSSCPSWCVNGSCTGEHSSDMLTVGASAAGACGNFPSTSGVIYPGVSARATSYSDAPVAVCLHFGDSRDDVIDVEVSLHPSEAKQLIENLQLILGQIAETAEAGR